MSSENNAASKLFAAQASAPAPLVVTTKKTKVQDPTHRLEAAADGGGEQRRKGGGYVAPWIDRPSRHGRALQNELDDDDSSGSVLTASKDWQDQVVELPVENCRVWKYNPRDVVDEDKLVELATAIRELNQIDPIVVLRSGETNKAGEPVYEIICGQRRWRAISRYKLREGMIKAKIVPGDTDFDTLMQLAVQTQANTEQLCDLDFALLVRKLESAGNESPEVALRKSKEVVTKLRALGGLPDKVHEHMRHAPSKFTYTMGYELSRYRSAVADDEKLYQLVLEICAEDLSIKEVRERIAVAGQVKSKTRRSWNDHDIDLRGKLVGKFRERASTGEVMISLRGIQEPARMKIRDFLQKLVSEEGFVDMDMYRKNKNVDDPDEAVSPGH